MTDKSWVSNAFKKTGSVRKVVRKGKKKPAKKIISASKKNSKLAKRKRPVQSLKKMHSK